MMKYMIEGGMLMWPMLLESIIGLAVIIDRWTVLKKAATDTSVLRTLIRQLLIEGKVEDAIRLCEETRGPVAAVLLVGLERYQEMLRLGRPRDEIAESVSRCMGDYAPHVLSALSRRVSLLLMIGSTAPLLGMTGTVTGMIKAFNAMAGAGALSGSVVAAGIAEALITTAMGLLIAVPAVFAYNMFNSRVEDHTARIEEAVTEFVDFIHLRGVPSQNAA